MKYKDSGVSKSAEFGLAMETGFTAFISKLHCNSSPNRGQLVCYTGESMKCTECTCWILVDPV